MELFEAVLSRRSIRKYKNDSVPKELIGKVLEAAVQAPSAKNRQPWRFVVVQGDAREKLAESMRAGLARELGGEAQLPGSVRYHKWVENTIGIMLQAPVTVLVLNPIGTCPGSVQTAEGVFYEMANQQSLAAAIQNMLLAAQALGLGGLWVCDVFFAYDEIRGWLGTDGQLAAAVCLGWPDEAPAARPRKPIQEVVQWLD